MTSNAPEQRQMESPVLVREMKKQKQKHNHEIKKEIMINGTFPSWPCNTVITNQTASSSSGWAAYYNRKEGCFTATINSVFSLKRRVFLFSQVNISMPKIKVHRADSSAPLQCLMETQSKQSSVILTHFRCFLREFRDIKL